METEITFSETWQTPRSDSPAAQQAGVAAAAQAAPADDAWSVGGVRLGSRLLLGTSRYPSPQVLAQAAAASGAQVYTVGLRRLQPESSGGQAFWQRVRELGGHLLPNTAGCHGAQQAVNLARMARELFGTHWIKLEVIGDDYTLQPDPFATLEAARVLAAEGFAVFAYTTACCAPWQPAVLGSRWPPSSRTRCQNACPPEFSGCRRRSPTVNTCAPEAAAARASTCGLG